MPRNNARPAARKRLTRRKAAVAAKKAPAHRLPLVSPSRRLLVPVSAAGLALALHTFLKD